MFISIIGKKLKTCTE